MRDGYLQLGVVILGFPVQVDPDAGHGKRMSRLGLVNVWNWNTLEERFRMILMPQKTLKEDIQHKNNWWNAGDSLADVHLFFWVKQIKQLHDRQKVCQGVLLNASRNELQQDPHQVVPPFIEPSSCKLKRKKSRTNFL